MKRGTTYQRKDGRWECRISTGVINGKRRYKSFYGSSAQEAECKMMTFMQTEPSSKSITGMTVNALAAEWLFVTENRIKESTAANYRMKLNKHILPYFGDISCNILSSKDIYAFIEHKRKSGLSMRYIADIIVLLKSIYRYACRECAIRNVLDSIIIPKRKCKEARILNKDEQHKLTSYLKANRSLVTLGITISLYTGLRIGELCALQWKDIDIKNKTITVRKTIQRIQAINGKRKTKLVITEPKSANSNRTIPVPECLIPIILQFIGESNSYVLSGNRKPVEPRTMQNRFKRILDNVKLTSINYHSLRHTFATGALEIGFDIKTLSEILGHSSVEVTLNRYIHSSMDRKRACMNMLSWSV